MEITPDDDANLQNATLVSDDGERHYLFDAGTASSAAATSLGRRVLAEQTAVQYYMSGPITAPGAIRTRRGAWQPVCKVRAGERVRLINYVDDITGDTGGLIVLITKTTYRDDTREAQLEAGLSDSFGTLGVLLAQRDLFRSDKVF